ncbi:GIY-YIG nuclease family protein [Parashewanella tropica]|uniref:GIY-YIG nuclease family protein n=1 Tax=Parashewanella tropica TaxID=2547970 RepID=UPI0014781E35|nr:GIY-YIG nuclease family protein [Parashewanella tropica]
MTKPKQIERFLQLFIIKHGLEFATLVMRLTRVPAHAPTLSRVFNVFYRRLYPGYATQKIPSKVSTAIKHLSDRKHDFESYAQSHWRIPTIRELPTGLIFDEQQYCYIPESNKSFKRLQFLKSLKGDTLLDELVNLSDREVYTDKIANAKAQLAKYTGLPLDVAAQLVKHMDFQQFPVWFKREDCHYLCQQLAQGMHFDDACKQVCNDKYQIEEFNLSPCTQDERRRIVHQLDDMFEAIKNEIDKSTANTVIKPSQYVYFVVLADNLIKIGGTKSNENLETRLKQHHSTYPKISTVQHAAVKDYKVVERAIKAAFCAKFKVFTSQYQDPKKTQELGQGEYFAIKKDSHQDAAELFEDLLRLLK